MALDAVAARAARYAWVRPGTVGHSWGRNRPGLTAELVAGYGRARLGDRLEVAAHDALVVDVLQHIALVGVVWRRHAAVLNAIARAF